MNVKMTVADAKAAHSYLSGLELKHFETSVTTPLLMSFISLAKVAQEYDEADKDLQKKLFDAHQEILNKIQKAQDKRATAKNDDEFREAHKEFLDLKETPEGVAYFDAEKQYIDARTALLTKEVEVKIEKVSRAKFLVGISKGDNSFTLDNLAKLQPLWKDN